MKAAALYRSRPLVLLSLAQAAVHARYRLSHGFGWIRLVGAVFDPYVYAATIYFVLSTVFRLDGMQRFYLLLVGVMAFRWALSSFVGAGALGEIRTRMAEQTTMPHTAAVVAVLAPQAFVFCLSLLSAIVLVLILNPQGQHFYALHWLPFLVAIQGIWTAVVVSALEALRRRGWIMRNATLIVMTSLLWILSPVMYTFEDIPETASRILTSYNPASHLLAGYHNALWFGEAVSLNVLPAAGVLGLAILAWFARRSWSPVARDGQFAAAPFPPVRLRLAPGPGTRPCLVCVAAGALRPDFIAAGETVPTTFVPWRERHTDWTGEDLARIIAAVGAGDRAARVARVDDIGARSGIGRLYGEFLIVYPDWALAQLAFAVAMASPCEALVIDGLLDEATPGFAAAAWADVEAAAAAGRAVAVVCYRPPRLPPEASGTYFFIGADGIEATGQIDPELGLRAADLLPVPEVKSWR